jgi:short subunit dehydrogenase-like uncharacterized protein
MTGTVDGREFDLIVYGATGFTGRLVAEHLLAENGGDRALRWAMAGRSRSKLEEVRAGLSGGADIPLVIADAGDPALLRSMCQRTRAVITTVGPYQLYGEPLVAACAETGTDYVDLCGEPEWMARMIAAYDGQAKASGARIVFSCGFDSIPFDLGVVFLEEEALARFGAPAMRVRGRVRRMKGTFSGGTAASLLATLEAAKRNPSVLKTLANPFALTPGFAGPQQPAGDEPLLDEAAGGWAAPFIMASINTKNVHRTNFLLGHRFGTDFVYDEMQMTGEGKAGETRARGMARAAAIQNLLLGFAPTRALLRRFALPKPGEGPNEEQRRTGFYDVLMVGEAADGRRLRAGVKGDRDPGYGSTSKMIAESAICLVRDVGRDQTAGGVWTPGAALGMALVKRLQAHAGMSFALEN